MPPYLRCMAALLVLNYDVQDRDGLEAYREAARPILLGTGGGEVLAISSETVDLAEGDRAGTDTVILRFASLGRAQEVMESDAYRAIVGLRFRSTTPRAAFIVSVDD
jgi:uncharacterized protein (DUF1330 family)